ncbi:MAG: pyridoxal phosphate-dependent decarboxylase family protein, partial [Planctomycetota bacterium]
MTDHPPQPDRAELASVIDLVVREATAYLDSLDDRRVRRPEADEAARRFDTVLTEDGVGAATALRELMDQGMDAAVHSAGPRFYHYVIGGTTPAALGADWLASTLDQLSATWITSPLAVQLELTSMAWLADLFGLPDDLVGVMTTGAMMANFTGLAAGRQWWGDRQGVDIARTGMVGLPAVPVFSSGYVHAASIKALGMLGIGRETIRTFSRDAVGRLDVDALEQALQDL